MPVTQENAVEIPPARGPDLAEPKAGSLAGCTLWGPAIVATNLLRDEGPGSGPRRMW